MNRLSPRTSAGPIALGLALAAMPVLAQDGAEGLRRRAEAVQARVAAIRGLEFRAEVAKGVKDPAELAAYLRAGLDRDFPAEQAAGYAQVYRTLGLIPEDLDLRAAVEALLTEQIAGFYDPRTRELYLIDRPMEGPQEAMLMAHELTHALQDQHFDLEPLMGSIRGDEDRSQALKAVVEGEATLVMFAWLSEEMGGGPADPARLPDVGGLLRMQERLGRLMGGASRAPPILQETLSFSYSRGATFVQRVLREGGWEAVSRLYDDGPTSTEQVLHPERFLRERDYPTRVILPRLDPALGEGWSETLADGLGELEVDILLRGFLDDEAASRASWGWDGDGFRALRGPEGREVLAWVTVWDSEKDAREFEEAYGEVRSRRGLDPEDGGLWRDGDVVRVLHGTRPEETARLAALLLAETRRVVTDERPLASAPAPGAPGATPEGGPLSAPAPLAGPVRSEPTPWTDAGRGVRLTVPAGWAETTFDDPRLDEFLVVAFAHPATPGAFAGLLEYPVPYDLEIIRRASDEYIRRFVRDFRVLSRRDLDLCGLDAHRVDFEGTVPALGGDWTPRSEVPAASSRGRSRGCAVVVAGEVSMYLFLGFAPLEAYEALAADFDLVVSSLALGEGAAPAEGSPVPPELAAPAAPAAPASGPEVRDAAGLFVLHRPEGWEGEAVREEGPYLRARLRGPGGVEVLVVVSPELGRGGLDEAAATLRRQLPLVRAGYRSLGGGALTVAGRAAREFRYEATSREGGAERTREVLLLDGGRRVVLRLGGRPEAVERASAGFDAVLASFRLGPEETPEAPGGPLRRGFRAIAAAERRRAFGPPSEERPAGDGPRRSQPLPVGKGGPQAELREAEAIAALPAGEDCPICGEPTEPGTERCGACGAALDPASEGGPREADSPYDEKAEILAQVPEVCERLEAMVGLEFRSEVSVGFKDREALGRYISETVDRDMTEGQLSTATAIYRGLGLVPAEFDLKRSLVELYTEQIGGFYDPKTKQMYLIEGPSIYEQTMTLSHELTHALQDQHFDLRAILEEHKDDDDAVVARQALIEGEGTLAMIAYAPGGLERLRQMPDVSAIVGMIESGMSGPQTPVLQRSPAILRESLVFPYLKGLSFAHRLLREGGWKAIGAAYGELPSSTEQLLHPEKYVAERDEPLRLRFAGLEAALGEGWEFLGANTLGEFQTRVLFEGSFDRSTAADAAAGWDGDRVAVLRRGKPVEATTGATVVGAGGPVLVWGSTWDTEGDAREFAGSYKKHLEARFPARELAASEKGRHYRWDEGGLSTWVELRGADVLVIHDAPADRLEALVGAAWGGLVRETVRPKAAAPEGPGGGSEGE
ncbi:MAG: hypothetical protein HY722_08135 [Planctomycetes bacterium]|nr:hypothetical protein [Planctomycetota bacterium]